MEKKNTSMAGILGKKSLIDSMVAPFPHKTAAEDIILINHFKVVFQISRPVSHGMAVFNQQKRFIRLLLHILLDFLQGRVHPAKNVNVVVIICPSIIPVKRTFITGQSGRVKTFCPLLCFLKSTSITAFISHRPDDNTGAVFLPVYTKFCTVHSSRDKVRVIRNSFIPFPAYIFPTGIL